MFAGEILALHIKTNRTTALFKVIINFDDSDASVVYEKPLNTRATMILAGLAKKQRDVILDALYDNKIFEYDLKVVPTSTEEQNQGTITKSNGIEYIGIEFEN